MENISTERILNRLDELLSRNDYASAEEHILYWIGEAERIYDNRTKLLLLNELAGLYRKLAKEKEALKQLRAEERERAKLEKEIDKKIMDLYKKKRADKIFPILYEYKGSGWDRGHMCPAGDNRWHWRAMDESFYMTNICPQNHNLNRGDWKELEEACRRWAAVESVYIVCGPILYKSPKYGHIGKKHQIRVPDAFFKVVLTGIESGRPQAIGFIYKNESGNYKRDKYVNSIDEVERITSLDFFSALPDKVEQAIEATYDLDLWP